MFLRQRILRVAVSRHAYVFPSPKNAPSVLSNVASSSRLTGTSCFSSTLAQEIAPAVISAQVRSNDSKSHPGASLQSLQDRDLLDIIRRTVETRKVVPSRKRQEPRNSYNRAAGTTYASVYVELRRRGSQSLMATHPEVLVYIVDHCVATGEMEVLKCAVEDSIKLYGQVREGQGSKKAVERRHRVLKGVLDALASSYTPRPRGPIPLQYHIHVLELFKAALPGHQLSNGEPDLTLDTLNGVLRSIISLSADWKRIEPLLDPLLLCVQNLPAPESLREQPSKPDKFLTSERFMNSISSRLHRLIHLMVIRELHSLSFSFLETLLQKGVIPPQAIEQSDSELDFHEFMLSVLLRWSACCGWSDRAFQALRTELPRGAKLPAVYHLTAEAGAGCTSNAELHMGLRSGEVRVSAEEFSTGRSASSSRQEHFSTLANDLLSNFLVADSSRLVQCSHIVGLMMSRFPSVRLNNTLIHTFFKAARETSAAAAAELMYATLRAAYHPDQYINGLLHGGVVPWLLGHLVYRSKNRPLAERLVRDLVGSRTEISSFERGDVIAICAGAGFVAETRSLWERYAVGPASKMVTGHTKCMVGIVKLFKRVSGTTAKTPADLEHGEHGMSETKETEFRDVASSDQPDNSAQSRDIGAAASRTIPRRISLGKEVHSNVVPMDGSSGAGASMKRDSSTGSNFVPEADALEPEPEASETYSATSTSRHDISLARSDVGQRGRHGGSESVTRNSVVSDDPEPDEYIVFAHKVLDAYRRAKEPLHRASHHDLNAIARTSDLLGNVRLSMQALQTIVNRKEIPDTYDVNVVMMAMAARDPLRAEEMLGLMLQEGMQLNDLTFTAVITGWLQKGDTKRASRVYSQAMRAGYGKLSTVVGTRLLVALVESCYSSELEGNSKEEVRADIWVQRTRLRQVCSLIKTESYRISSLPPDLGERCTSVALRLEDAGLALYFWKALVKTAMLIETDQQRELRHSISRLLENTAKKGLIGAEERERMIAELGPL